ncbi:MAG: DUF721 domain-containing protein [Sedimentisphaerales bacterium]|nr:DUF721 domain-containing protein [Sedimentisphaerales bacterium]
MDSEQTRYGSQPAYLGDVLAKLIEPGPAGLARRYETCDKLRFLWSQLLPPVMAEHCRLVDFSQGVLVVEADSPSFLYELRMSSKEIVKHLKQSYPAAKIREIKVILAR